MTGKGGSEEVFLKQTYLASLRRGEDVRVGEARSNIVLSSDTGTTILGSVSLSQSGRDLFVNFACVCVCVCVR